MRTRTDTMLGLTGLALAGLLLAGCSGDDDEKDAAQAAPTSSAEANGSGGGAANGPSTTAGQGSATAGLPSASPSITAAETSFGSTTRFTDGVLVQATAVGQGTVTATGPGELTGRPYTSFAITFTNRSDRALDLTKVSVVVEYGSQKVNAQPVYDKNFNDFATRIEAGKTAKATYAFSIPKSNLNSVTMRVNFAADHTPATFVGRVTIR